MRGLIRGLLLCVVVLVPADVASAVRTTDWMHQGKYGVMVHWTRDSLASNGFRFPSYCDQVAVFDVDRFARQLSDAGAAWLIFTIDHGYMELPFPSAEVDRIMGNGSRTCDGRDLPAELHEALDPLGIKMVFYYNWPPFRDTVFNDLLPLWNNNAKSVANTHAILSEIGNRYGQRLAGWWLDAMYDDVDLVNCKTDGQGIGRRFDKQALANAARSGNADRLIAMNFRGNCSWTSTSGGGTRTDYAAGEIGDFSRLPSGRFSGEGGTQWHQLSPMDNFAWAYEEGTPPPSPRFADQTVVDNLKAINAGGGVFTYNAAPRADDLIATATISQLETVKARIRGALTRVDDTDDPRVTYSGGWTQLTSAGSFHGSIHRTTTANAFVDYSCKCSGVRLTGTNGPGHGNVDIYVDGVYQTTVNTSGPARKVNVPIFEKRFAENDSHTLRVVRRDGTVEVDSFDHTVLGP